MRGNRPGRRRAGAAMLAAAVALGFTLPAGAEAAERFQPLTVTPPIDEVCITAQNAAGDVEARLDKRRFLDWVIGHSSVPVRALEAQRYGEWMVDYGSKIEAVLYAYTADALPPCAVETAGAAHCDFEKVREPLNEASVYIEAFLKRVAAGQESLPFRFSGKTTSSSVKFLGKPGLTHAANNSGPADFQIACIKDLSVVQHAKNTSESAESFPFIIAEGPEDLFESSYRRRDPATFSFTGDKKSGSRQYEVDGLVGYVFDGTEFAAEPEEDETVEPHWLYEDTGVFAKWARRVTAETDDGADSEINAVTFGVRRQAPAVPTDFATLTLGGDYVTDSHAETQVLSGQLDLTAAPRVAGVEFGAFNFWGPILAKPSVRARLEGGRVFDDGGNAKLRKDDDFLRAGPILSLRLVPAPTDLVDWEQRLSLSVDYRSLWLLSGETDDLERFEAALDFALDEAGRFQINTKYRNGNVDATLQDSEVVTVGLGVRN